MHQYKTNGELCIVVGPVTSTAGELAYCMLLIGSHPRWFKGQRGRAPWWWTLGSMCKSLVFFSISNDQS